MKDPNVTATPNLTRRKIDVSHISTKSTEDLVKKVKMQRMLDKKQPRVFSAV